MQSYSKFPTSHANLISFQETKEKKRVSPNPMAGLTTAMAFMYLLGFSILRNSMALQTISPTQSLSDGETLVSTGRTFELGFFSPEDSKGRYLGLWYVNVTPRTVVWVANRDVPLSNIFGSVNVSNQGNLVLLDRTSSFVVWSSNASRTALDPVAELLDSGNLVVRDRNDNPENFLWQSFDYPGDTLLPGMKLGVNLETGFERFLSSWKSNVDPARGQYSVHIVTGGYPQLVLRKETRILYRAGSWNGLGFTGNPGFLPNPLFMSEFVFDSSEVSFSYKQRNISSPSRYALNSSGDLQLFFWNIELHNWVLYTYDVIDVCDRYAICGSYGRCNFNNSLKCECLDGFVPRSPKDWNLADWSGGCIRKTPLDCNGNDSFQKFSGVKLPDTASSWYDDRVGLVGCQALCVRNCSCTAYAKLDVREDVKGDVDIVVSASGGSGCLLWFDALIDIKRDYSTGQDLYVKVAASQIVRKMSKGSSPKHVLPILVPTCVGTGTLILGIIIFLRRRNRRKHATSKRCEEMKGIYEGSEEDIEMPIFDFTTISNATNNFSNKIGEGGFGPVYKGTLMDGKEIAVKMLSKSSGQGLNEFRNEVIVIAKLQHRNLVKLLGFCIHGDEKMLIYEYMPNKSLDSFIFDQTRSSLLDWHRRFHIIQGIARGLIYLHQDSRLRIIHRDLKVSNILLDNDMNPKISDFGLARTFGGDQTEAITNRVVGTFGYISPEYAMDGNFSTKSDVFSFGVLVLEMVTGKKNRGFCHPDHCLNLLGHAWILWIKGKPTELVDEKLINSSNLSQVLRCIHVALLCVQQRPEDRPNMSSVVLMLGSENPLPRPKQPGFYMGRNPSEMGDGDSSNKQEPCSVNEATITMLEAR